MASNNSQEDSAIDLAVSPAVLERLPHHQIARLVHREGIEECMSLLLALPSKQLIGVADALLWSESAGQSLVNHQAILSWLRALGDEEAEARVSMVLRLGEDYLSLLVSHSGRVISIRDAVESSLHDTFSPAAIPFEHAFGDYVVELLPQSEDCGEILLALLDDLHESEPEMLQRVLHKCVESFRDDDNRTREMVREQLEGDLAEERLARRRELGFLAPEDASFLLREIRFQSDVARVFELMTRFRRRPTPSHQRLSWENSEIAPLLGSQSLFAARLNELCQQSPEVEAALQEDLGILSNILAHGAHLGTELLEPHLAPNAVRALCELGAGKLHEGGTDYPLACFQSGWRWAQAEAVLPVARALDRILSNRNAAYLTLRECWFDMIVRRGGRAPCFARLTAQGELLTASLLIRELSAVLPARVAQTLTLIISEIPALPAFLLKESSDRKELGERCLPVFPSTSQHLEAAKAFACRLESEVC